MTDKNLHPTDSHPSPPSFKVKTMQELVQMQAKRLTNQHFCTVIEKDRELTLTFGQLYEKSMDAAKAMLDAGINPGDRVALMLPTGISFLCAYYGALLCGVVPTAIVPPFLPRKKGFYVNEKAGLLKKIETTAIITTATHESVCQSIRDQVPGLDTLMLDTDLDTGKAFGNPFAPVTPEQIAMIQFSSGSNGRQKAVALTHGNIVSNLKATHLAMDMTPEDVMVSWLPLYHDMGLLGCVCQSLYAGCKLALMSPMLFISSPGTWLTVMHEKSGTITVSPNFGYQLCAHKVMAPENGQMDLSRWRLALNGAEMVTRQTISHFVDKFGPAGFRATTFMPVYGLAEATVSVCFTPLGTGMVTDTINLDAFTGQGIAQPASPEDRSCSFVSAGKPVPGVKAKIVDDQFNELADRVQGRLFIKAPSVMHGYFNDPDATAAVFRDGWLDTGDLAYKAKGFIFITGRSKDVIIKAGRNYSPEHFELALREVQGLRKNCAAAFSIDNPKKGTEDIVVMAETKITEQEPLSALTQDIRQAIHARLELSPDDVYLVPPYTIPKTSSGKVQRPLCRWIYLTRCA